MVSHGKPVWQKTKTSFSSIFLTDFRTLVNERESLWLQGRLEGPAVAQFLLDMDTLYASLLTGDRWTITAEPDPKIVALATENANLKKELKSEKNKSQQNSKPNGDGGGPYVKEKGIEVSGPPGSPGTQGHSIPLWCSTKKGPCIG